MLRVMQPGRRCLQACVASIFGVPLAAAPPTHRAASLAGLVRTLKRWLARRGMAARVFTRPPGGWPPDWPPGVPVIGCCTPPDGGRHAVVCRTIPGGVRVVYENRSDGPDEPVTAAMIDAVIVLFPTAQPPSDG